jgi:hypothetical protein
MTVGITSHRCAVVRGNPNVVITVFGRKVKRGNSMDESMSAVDADRPLFDEEDGEGDWQHELAEPPPLSHYCDGQQFYITI